MNAPTGATIPNLGRGFRRQWEAAQDCHVMLEMYQLELDILWAMNGAMAQRYGVST